MTNPSRNGDKMDDTPLTECCICGVDEQKMEDRISELERQNADLVRRCEIYCSELMRVQSKLDCLVIAIPKALAESESKP